MVATFTLLVIMALNREDHFACRYMGINLCDLAVASDLIQWRGAAVIHCTGYATVVSFLYTPYRADGWIRHAGLVRGLSSGHICSVGYSPIDQYALT